MAWLCGLNLLLVLLLPMACTSTPDAVVRLNQAFLNHVSHIGIAPLQQALNFKMANFVKREGKELLLKVIQILNVNVTHLHLEFNRIGIRLKALASFSLRITQQYPRLRKPVPLDLKMEVPVMADINVTQSSLGSPMVSVPTCKAHIYKTILPQNSYSMQPEIMNLVTKHIQDNFKEEICLRISSLVQSLNVYLGTSIGLNPVGPKSQILYFMARAPTLTKNYISLDIKMALLLLGKPIVLPVTDTSFTLPKHVGTKDAMITVGLSQRLFDSILLLLHRAGALNMEITGDMKSNDNLLNTYSLGQLIPEVAHQFPQSKPVVIKVRVVAIPVVKLHTNKATLQLQPLVEVLAMTSKSTFQSLFSLNVVLNLNLQFSVSKVKIQGNTSVLGDVKLTLASSNVGAINMAQVQAFMGTVFEKPLLNQLNALLGMGLFLPKVSRCYYVNPKVIVHKGFIEISSGFSHQTEVEVLEG